MARSRGGKRGYSNLSRSEAVTSPPSGSSEPPSGSSEPPSGSSEPSSGSSEPSSGSSEPSSDFSKPMLMNKQLLGEDYHAIVQKASFHLDGILPDDPNFGRIEFDKGYLNPLLPVQIIVRNGDQVETSFEEEETTSNTSSAELMMTNNKIVDVPTSKSSGKTEPANSYLQFVAIKKAQLEKTQPGTKINRKLITREWNSLGSDEKQFYKDLAQVEKLKLGKRFRENRKRKPKKPRKVKNIKTPKKSSNPQKPQKTIVEPQLNQMESLINELEAVENEISEALEMNDKLKDTFYDLKVKVGVKGNEIGLLENEVFNSKQKYDYLETLHGHC